MLPVDEIRLNFNPASLVVLNGVLGFLMFGIALDTRVADFKRVLRMPGAMAVGIAAQFIVLPAVTFALTLLLQPWNESPPEALRAFPPLSQRCALRARGRRPRCGAALARRPALSLRQFRALRDSQYAVKN